MKLLFSKKRTRNSKGDFSIAKSTLTIRKSGVDILINDDEDYFGGVGFNSIGNICLYITKKESNGMYKLYRANDSMRISINSKSNEEKLKPFVGAYKIKYVNQKENNILEAELIKL